MKHKRKLIRKKDHNYNWHGSYFITTCTKDKIDYFGSIDNLEMELSSIGQIALDCWNEIIKHFDDVELDEFVVMPNHVHGVIHLLPDERFDEIRNDVSSNVVSVGDADLNNGFTQGSKQRVLNQFVGANHGLNDANSDVGKRHAFSLRARQKYLIKRMHERLPIIIGSYKSAVTRLANQQLKPIKFKWQSSYHDRIIRNDQEMALVRQYIHNNPINWQKDSYNPVRVDNLFNKIPISGKII